MNQKQKDTTREEWKNRLNNVVLNALHNTRSTETDMPYGVLSSIQLFIQAELDEAYQQGAKDKVEEVEKCVRECAGAYDFVPPPELINLLKDNT
jgi:hypothetical protein